MCRSYEDVQIELYKKLKEHLLKPDMESLLDAKTRATILDSIDQCIENFSAQTCTYIPPGTTFA